MANEEELHAVVNRFQEETDPIRKAEVGKGLISAIFGKNALPA